MTLPSSATHVAGLATIVFVLGLSLLGLLSIAFVLHFRLKTNSGQFIPLRDFNSLWTMRILLVLFASLWALNELVRLPLFRHPPWFFSSLTLKQQIHLCKIYTLSSHGLFQPLFLMTALFLLKGSLQSDQQQGRNREKANSSSANRPGKALLVVLLSSLPLFLFQFFSVFITPRVRLPGENRCLSGLLPEVFVRDFVVRHGNIVLCVYPLASTILLGGFVLFYIPCFLIVCWRMVLLVINKRLRVRVYGLALGVLLSLPIQVLCLGVSVYWRPGETVFEVLSFVGFFSVLFGAVVNQGILVIRPIADALAVGLIETGKGCSVGVGASNPAVVVEFSPDLEGQESLLGGKTSRHGLNPPGTVRTLHTQRERKKHTLFCTGTLLGNSRGSTNSLSPTKEG